MVFEIEILDQRNRHTIKQDHETAPHQIVVVPNDRRRQHALRTFFKWTHRQRAML
jgi:hypothetical protein